MDDQSTLLQLQELKIANVKRKEEKKDAVGLWDPGSTLSFITFDLASSLGLQGQPVKLEIVTVGGVLTKVKSRKYHKRESGCSRCTRPTLRGFSNLELYISGT